MAYEKLFDTISTASNILLIGLGVFLIYLSLDHWYFRIIDTRILPFFIYPYSAIFRDLLFGFCLILVSYLSFKNSRILKDFTIVLLCFPVFCEIPYFFIDVGIIVWLVGILILLLNIELIYKIIVLLAIGFTVKIGTFGELDYYFIALILLFVKLILEMKNFSGFLKYKMERRNVFIFGIVLIPFILSELAKII